jgi:ABC-type glycerol-3-phosphate transport system substrate-binding protein
VATNHSPVEVPWFRKVLDGFALDNTAYQVEQTNVTARYLEQVASWGAEGKLPDVVYVRSAHAAAWAYKHWIAPIDDLVARDGQAIGIADFHPLQVEELKLDGKWLLLPYDYSGQCLYSRADAYPDAATAPRDDWSWTDLAAAAKQATRKDAAGTRWGFAWAADASALPGLWLAEGGTFRREDGRGISISSAEHVRITQWLADLALVDGSAPKPGEVGAGALVAGKLGAEVEDASAAAGYRAAGAKVRATALPKGSVGRRASYATGSGWGLAQSAKDREGAWKLLRHLSSRDSLEILVALPVRSLPGRVSAVPLWQAGLEAMGTLEHPEAIVGAASDGFPHRQAVWWLNYQDAFGDLMPAVWGGQRKAADVLPELEKRVNAEAARYFS